MLQSATDGVTTAQFLDAHIPRFSARIMELRNAGHAIERVRVSDSSYVYKLATPSSSLGCGKPVSERVSERVSDGGLSRLPSDSLPSVSSVENRNVSTASSSRGGANSSQRTSHYAVEEAW